MDQILRPVREDVVLLVERLRLLLGNGLIVGDLPLDLLLFGLRVGRSNQSFLILLLQLCSLRLQIALLLGPALLRFLGLLLKRGAFALEQIALRQHGLHLYESNVAAAYGLRRSVLRRLRRTIALATRNQKHCSGCDIQNFLHTPSYYS